MKLVNFWTDRIGSLTSLALASTSFIALATILTVNILNKDLTNNEMKHQKPWYQELLSKGFKTKIA